MVVHWRGKQRTKIVVEVKEVGDWKAKKKRIEKEIYGWKE